MPGFDGLRIVAAAGLAAYHAIGAARPGRNPAIGVILPPAAYVFFLISGFVIYRPLVAAHLGGADGPDPVRFWIERACRVLPLWWTALAVYLLVNHPTLPGPVDAVLTLTSLQYLRAGARFAVIGPAWALSVEWIFYLLAPLLALACRRLHRLGRARLTAAGAHALVLAGLAVATATWGAARPFLGIVAGMAAATVDAAGLVRRGLPGRITGPVAATVTGGGWLILCRWPYGPGISVQWCQRDPALSLVWLTIALAWFLPVAFAPARGAVARTLGAPVARRLAELTFGLYLWHQLVLDQLLERLGPRTPLASLALATIVGGAAIGALTLNLVERPGRQLARRTGLVP